MTSLQPHVVVVPENRYDLLADARDTRNPSIAVVIPVYNGADRLARVLDGLGRQSRPADEIVVADDGSEEDIAGVVDRYADLPIRYERQLHDGFGAARARNLGARSSRSDVIVFVDGDCIPHSKLIESHARWHAKTANLVVIGGRYHVDETSLPPTVGDALLHERADLIPEDGAPDDWRRIFYSTNRWLRTGDDAFRAFVTSNSSVTRSAFEGIGGFSERFKEWGGEDTELGWRLWNAGATFAVESKAVVFHQISPVETREGREKARRAQKIAFADAIPHRFYRPGGASFYSVPHCSWIVNAATPDEMLAAWDGISRSQYPDTELIAIGPPEALAHLDGIDGNDRVTVLTDGSVEDAVGVARGEFVVFVDGLVAVNPGFLTSAMALAGSSPRVAYIRGAYLQPGGTTVRSLSDIEALDAVEGRRNLPLLAAVRRREIMKDLNAGRGVDWPEIVARSKEGLTFEASELAGVDAFIDQPSSLGLREVRKAGLEQTGRAARKVIDRIPRRD